MAGRSLLRYKDLLLFLLHAAMTLGFFLSLIFSSSLERGIYFVATILIVYIAVIKRVDYLDPLVGYLIPWVVILLFSVTKISLFAIPIHLPTYSLVITAIIGALFVAGGSEKKASFNSRWLKPGKSVLGPRTAFILIDLVFVSLTIFNILAAGYVPLLRGFSTGDTGYMEFGIHGVYGFYLALANALAIIYFIIFLRTGKRIYLVRYLAILALFILLVTRQNLISVAVESAVAYSLIRGRIRWRTILVSLALGGMIFAFIGSFRSGDIREMAGIEKKYSWIPDPVIWLYAYSYFNIANMDNLVTQSEAPYYNASSISFLIPSSLRPTYDMGNYLLLANFNVSSYMFPVYQDVGRTGVFLLTVLALWLTARQYRILGQATTISQVGIYCVLYFCASFSFFFNFWFFLPVVFQIVFFKIFGNISELACLPGCNGKSVISLQALGAAIKRANNRRLGLSCKLENS